MLYILRMDFYQSKILLGGAAFCAASAKRLAIYRDKFKLIMAKLGRKDAPLSRHIQSYLAIFAASDANYAAKFEAKF